MNPIRHIILKQPVLNKAVKRITFKLSFLISHRNTEIIIRVNSWRFMNWIEEAPFEVKFAEIRKDNSIISVFYSVTNFLFHLLGWNYCSSNISWVINNLDLWNKFRIRPRKALTKMSGYFMENVLYYKSIYCKVFSCKIHNLIRHLFRKKVWSF